MSNSVSVNRRLSETELNDRLKTAESAEIYSRLGFIKNLYQGDAISEAIAREGRSESTGYRWVKDWNDGGFEALVPDRGGGRPPKLTDAEQEAFLEQIKRCQPVSTATIKSILHSEFDVEYAADYLLRKLESMGLRYRPPARETVDQQAVGEAIECDKKDPEDSTQQHPYDNRSSRPEAGWRIAE